MDLFKLVARDKNGKVMQIHELYKPDVERILFAELEKGNSVTVSKL